MRNSSTSPNQSDVNPLSDSHARHQAWLWLAAKSTELSAHSARPKTLAEAEHFASAYRASTTHLARLRAFSPDRGYTSRVERVVAVAHLALYRGRTLRLLDIFFGFIFGVPKLILRHWPYHVASVAITLVSAAVAYAAVMLDPGWFDLFIDPNLSAGRNPYASTEELAGFLKGGDLSAENLTFSAFLFTHNTRIALLCFGLGFALGLPTIYLLVTNGLMLGAFVACYSMHGLTFEMMGWLLPHGIPEIGAIIICGGAGLMMGHRLLNPGTKSRRDAMVNATREASMTAMCAVPLLALAGVIEGIFREADFSNEVRYAMLMLVATLMTTWLVMGYLYKLRGQSAPLVTKRP